MVFNITNGDYFNNYFCQKHKEQGVPFREAMMTGAAHEYVFSHEFIDMRAGCLGVDAKQYQKNVTELIAFKAEKDKYNTVRLWFGLDAFCQLNLLTLLAYLEQINYGGEIELNIIDDESFTVLDRVAVKLGKYADIYKTVLINRVDMPDTGVISKRAITLYFDYLSPDGNLARAIKSNGNMPQDELMCFVMDISKEYGLSDLQATELIRKYLG